MTESAPPSLRVGYLGPPGTFTEQALLTQPDLAAAEHVLYPSMPDVLAATEAGEVDLGFTAIENSIEGTVNIAQDTLAFEAELFIQREVVISVELDLLVRPGTPVTDVKRIMTFPHARAQCQRFLREHLPGVEFEATNSTADAARLLSERDDGHAAAIGTSLAARLYGLEIAASDIEDHPENRTRFVAVARRGLPKPTGHDKTSIVIFQREDHPGSLLSLLQEFAARRINLTKLESRPTRQALGSYCFFIDLEGHIADEKVADCLKNILVKEADVKFLGSYPAAGDENGEVRERHAAAWDDAEAWVEALRDQLGG